MEIEAKFRIDSLTTFADLLTLNQLGAFALAAAPHAEHQHNTYFDTSDQRLRAQHYGFRIRAVGTRRIATLKGAARYADGLYERGEWEAEIGDDPDPQGWPPSETRDRLLALLAGAALVPTLTIDTRRQHIYAARNAARFAELSLDDGVINAGALTETIRELEIELLGGAARADFDELVRLLRARYSLVPEERSKLARGLSLLEPPAKS